MPLDNQYPKAAPPPKEGDTQQGYRVPTDIVKLPSKGLLYPKDNPLSSGEVEMKAMTAREEDILTTESYIRKGIVTDKLLESLIVSPIDYKTILLGDKMALMLAARVGGYGKDYEVKVETPSGKEITTIIDLTEFKDKELDESLITPHVNCFKFELPLSGRIVEFKLLSQGDSVLIEKEIEKNQRRQERDITLSTRMKSFLISVDGNKSKAYISNFVDNELLTPDSRDLRKYINKVQPDVDLTVELFDGEANESFRIELPFTLDFFWPRSEV